LGVESDSSAAAGEVGRAETAVAAAKSQNYQRLEPVLSGGKLFGRSGFVAPVLISSWVRASSGEFEISRRILTCDGSALAYCRSIHFTQKRLICSEFGIPYMSKAQFGTLRRFLESHVFKKSGWQTF
jgi:hypothetical protein